MSETFRQYIKHIQESLDSMLPFQCIENNSQNCTFKFTFDGVDFIVKFTFTPAEDKVIAVVAFFSLDEHGQENTDLTFKHKSSLLLFSTVVNIIKQTINKWDVLCFVNEPDRYGLYSLLVKRFTKEFKVSSTNTQLGTVWFISKFTLPSEMKDLIGYAAQQILDSK